MARPSVMSHDFSRIPRAEIQRSRFDRSHGYKTTFDSGYLVPIFVDEVLPGDTFSLRANLFARMSTPITPFMDNLFLETFWFFVPNRLIWDNWQRFNGQQDNPDDSTDFMVPTIDAGFFLSYHSDGQLGSNPGETGGILANYFGIPFGNIQGSDVSSLPFRAYNLTYNEWFRDQNLQDSVPVIKGDGPDGITNYSLLRRGKRHDYFTSCLPWPQKGPGVELPLGGEVPIDWSSAGDLRLDASVLYQAYGALPTGSPVGDSFRQWAPIGVAGNTPDATMDASYGQVAVSSWLDRDSGLTYAPVQSDLSFPGQSSTAPAPGSGTPVRISGTGGTIDLSSATAATINSLRQAFQVQRLLERDARGGTRYTEILRSHFGVVSPDSRLQRPEYLGGSHTRININPVQQTSASDSTTPQGNLAAFGVAGDSFHGFTKSFVEHGIILGLVNVRADLTYQQGLNRMWSRRSRFDFYWPALAHLGEQAVLSQEIFYSGGDAANDSVFGYQERWAEYRYKPSMITGKFQSADPQPLDVWHLSQFFGERPLLNDVFIQDNPPIKRVVAVQDEPEFLLDAYFQLKCTRPMPLYSVPGMIDHF